MGKYQIIYADPPWSYRSGKVQGAAQNHYPTMSDERAEPLSDDDGPGTVSAAGIRPDG